MQLSRFFENQFDSPEISRQELRITTEDHLKKLSVQNTNNRFDNMISVTEGKYTAFFGNIQDADTLKAIRQSRTISMNNVMTGFKKEVTKRRKLVGFTFEETSPEYQEFFPAGADEYSSANLENVETLMDRLVKASTRHQAKLGAETATVFNQLLLSFQQARGIQLTGKASVTDAIKDVRASELALQLQLTDNLLVIAREHIGNPEACKLFFDQNLLDLADAKKADAADASPAAPVVPVP